MHPLVEDALNCRVAGKVGELVAPPFNKTSMGLTIRETVFPTGCGEDTEQVRDEVEEAVNVHCTPAAELSTLTVGARRNCVLGVNEKTKEELAGTRMVGVNEMLKAAVV